MGRLSRAIYIYNNAGMETPYKAIVIALRHVQEHHTCHSNDLDTAFSFVARAHCISIALHVFVDVKERINASMPGLPKSICASHNIWIAQSL